MTVTILDNQSPLREQDVMAVEEQLGIRLPPEYRRFMLRCNGGRTKPDGFDIVWAQGQPPAEDWRTSTLSWIYFIWENREANLLRKNQVTFAGRLPPGTLAIAEDAGGNPILLAWDGPYKGNVLFWASDYEVESGQVPGYQNVGFIADSFDDFLNHKLR